ncbi:MAG: 2-phosphosulfolactate phosphatase [Bacteroidia bacterium]|nr:2-phosphosulfolactate phosphatase [Bacteroidia bacterium]
MEDVPTVRVCVSPALIPTYSIEQSTVVVIDILRATTSICVAFDYGVSEMIPVETIEECKTFKEQGFLGAAERNGHKIEGFDFGNSPYSYMRDDIRGKKVAITTTNGTQAIHAAASAKEIVIGSFANLTVLTQYLKQTAQDVVLLCAGWKLKMNLEDTIFAGALAEALLPEFEPIEDAVTVARMLYREANRNKKFYLQHSTHYHKLMKMKLQQDVKYCLRQDTHPVLPVLRNGVLINLHA